MKSRSQFAPRWPCYFLACVIVLLSIYTIVGERGALHLWRLKRERAQLDEHNYRLQKENEALRQRISRLRYDDRFLEKVAREELNLVRPGEVIYRFPSSEPKKSRARALSDPLSESRPSKERTARR